MILFLLVKLEIVLVSNGLVLHHYLIYEHKISSFLFFFFFGVKNGGCKCQCCLNAYYF